MCPRHAIRYAQQVHDKFTGDTSAYGGAWYNWDHLLDQHVGLWFGGDAASCDDRFLPLREALAEAKVPVGERGESDAHEM